MIDDRNIDGSVTSQELKAGALQFLHEALDVLGDMNPTRTISLSAHRVWFGTIR